MHAWFKSRFARSRDSAPSMPSVQQSPSYVSFPPFYASNYPHPLYNPYCLNQPRPLYSWPSFWYPPPPSGLENSSSPWGQAPLPPSVYWATPYHPVHPPPLKPRKFKGKTKEGKSKSFAGGADYWHPRMDTRASATNATAIFDFSERRVKPKRRAASDSDPVKLHELLCRVLVHHGDSEPYPIYFSLLSETIETAEYVDAKQQRVKLPDHILLARATEPPRTTLSILYEDLGWKSEVKPLSGLVFITVRDVLLAIWKTGRQPLTPMEWYALRPSQQQRALKAWNKRRARPESRYDQMMRVDLLGESVGFLGLTPRRGDGYCTIRFGKPSVPK